MKTSELGLRDYDSSQKSLKNLDFREYGRMGLAVEREIAVELDALVNAEDSLRSSDLLERVDLALNDAKAVRLEVSSLVVRSSGTVNGI